jgi:hypothetical protein
MFMLLLMMVCSLLSFDRRAWLESNWKAYPFRKYKKNHREQFSSFLDKIPILGTHRGAVRKYNQMVEQYPFIKNSKGTINIGGEVVVRPHTLLPYALFIAVPILGYLLIGLPLALPLTTFTSITTGDWDEDSTWDEGSVPTSADDVIIDTGDTVTMDEGDNYTVLSLSIVATGVLNLHNDQTFTVTNLTSVTGTLTCNASTCSFGSGGSGSPYRLDVNAGTFNGGSGNHTIGSLRMRNSGSLTLSSGTTTIDSQNSSSAFRLDVGSFDDGNGTLAFTYAGNQWLIDDNNTARTFYNLTVNKASGTLQFFNGKGFSLTIDNDLTITSGEFDTSDETAGTSRDLTVTGDVDITGTLTGNASAMIMKSLTINSGGVYNATSGITTLTGESPAGQEIDVVGTYTHNSGTLTLSTNMVSDCYFRGTGNPYNLIVEDGTSRMLTDFIISNDLIVSSGVLKSKTSKKALTVSGDVLVNGGTLGDPGETETWSFGSLSVGSGATYSASSGTNSILGVFNIDVAGTLTENGGTFSLNGADVTFDWTTDTGGTTVLISGQTDMDAITISAGDTLDINSKNIYISGDIDIDGTLTMGAGGFIQCAGNFDIDGTWGDGAYNGTLMMTGASKTFDMGGTSFGLKNFIINSSGSISGAGSDAENIFVIEGEHSFGAITHAIRNNGDYRVSDGATANLGTGVLDLTGTGNFQNSGGFIGRSALGLDGSTEYVTTADHASLDVTNITLEGWIRTIASSDYWISRASKFNMRLNGSGKAVGDIVATGTSTVTSTTSVNDGLWHHVAVTYDGTTTSIYVDGLLEDTDTTASGNMSAGATGLYIGSFVAPSAFFNGEIGYVRMWSDARTQAEILTEMFSSYSDLAATTNLVSMWQFDEGAGTAVADSHGANTGTASASTVWVGSGTYSGASATLTMGTGDMILLDALVYGSGTPSDVIEMGGSSAIVGFTFDSSADVTLVNSGNLVSDDHNTTAGRMDLCLTSLSYSNMKIQPVSDSDITLVTGIWTLGITADLDQYGDLVIDAGTTIQVVEFCDIYVDSFTNNGTWNRTSPYLGTINVGSPPFSTGNVLDANIKLDNILDTINIID